MQVSAQSLSSQTTYMGNHFLIGKKSALPLSHICLYKPKILALFSSLLLTSIGNIANTLATGMLYIFVNIFLLLALIKMSSL